MRSTPSWPETGIRDFLHVNDECTGSELDSGHSPSFHPRFAVEIIPCAAGFSKFWNAHFAKVDFPSFLPSFGSKPALQLRHPHAQGGGEARK